jgi:hypothetical protein
MREVYHGRFQRGKESRGGTGIGNDSRPTVFTASGFRCRSNRRPERPPPQSSSFAAAGRPPAARAPVTAMMSGASSEATMPAAKPLGICWEFD